MIEAPIHSTPFFPLIITKITCNVTWHCSHTTTGGDNNTFWLISLCLHDNQFNPRELGANPIMSLRGSERPAKFNLVYCPWHCGYKISFSSCYGGRRNIASVNKVSFVVRFEGTLVWLVHWNISVFDDKIIIAEFNLKCVYCVKLFKNHCIF